MSYYKPDSDSFTSYQWRIEEENGQLELWRIRKVEGVLTQAREAKFGAELKF